MTITRQQRVHRNRRAADRVSEFVKTIKIGDTFSVKQLKGRIMEYHGINPTWALIDLVEDGTLERLGKISLKKGCGSTVLYKRLR